MSELPKQIRVSRDSEGFYNQLHDDCSGFFASLDCRFVAIKQQEERAQELARRWNCFERLERIERAANILADAIANHPTALPSKIDSEYRNLVNQIYELNKLKETTQNKEREG